MSNINDLNLGELKGGSVHLDAQTVLRLKHYRIDHLNTHPGKPVPDVSKLVRHAVNAWLDENGFAAVAGDE